MRISEWVAIAQRDAKSYRQVVCEACGAETLTGGDTVAFCSNCESVVGSETKTLQGSNPMLFSLLDSIRMALLKNDFEAAATAYDQIEGGKPSPQLLYARGLMLIEQSNYTVSLIKYDGEGFMEHNAELRERGGLLVSEGKKLIAKSLSLSAVEAAQAPSANVFYRMFLCALKMGNLRAANDYSERIAALDKASAISTYARMVLDLQGGLYKEAEKELETIFEGKNPPANAFYYAAFVAFKSGDRKGAVKLIGAAGGLIEEQKKATLLEAIQANGE